MSGKVVSIIQARTGSTRLPGKVLLDLEGRTVLEHVIARTRLSRLTDEVVVATSINRKDLAIVKICADLGISVFCGSEEDPLDRYYQTARVFRAAHVVRIKADCPLIDPEIIDEAISSHLASGADYTSNTIIRTYPAGQDVEILTFAAMKHVWQHANLMSDREHVTLYIPKHPEQFSSNHFQHPGDLSKKRWTMDRPEDYTLIRFIFQHLYKKNPTFGMRETLEFLSHHEEMETINQHIDIAEGVRISLSNEKEVEREGY
jgi:spore coat polysaccharide biosynthesis protein SpsF